MSKIKKIAMGILGSLGLLLFSPLLILAFLVDGIIQLIKKSHSK